MGRANLLHNEAKRESVRGLSFFKDIDDSEKDILLEAAEIRSYSKRTPLFFQGDQVNKLMIVIRGWIRLYNLTDDGNETTVSMLGRGDVLGDAATFNVSTKHPFSAAAAEDLQLIEIPTCLLRKRVWVNATLVKQIMTIMTHKITSLQIENGNLANMNAEQRLSCLLLRLSAWMTGKGGSFSLPYDKSIMASQLGVELATFSRTLTKLEEKGVTKQGGEITIKSFEVLSECCCRFCPVPEGQCSGRRLPPREDKKVQKSAA